MFLEPGQVVGNYVVEGRLGEGGMAAVYRVRHQTLGGVFALKVLTVASLAVRDRMIQEGQFQATLKHSNIVRVVDVLEVSGSIALLMDFVKGPSLERLMKHRRLSPDEIRVVMGAVLGGMAEAHKQGRVHRDLKPDNILMHITNEGVFPQVADFGIAKSTHRDERKTNTQVGASIGTPQYMAPEQVKDASSVDVRADVWSIGVILYELVTGKMAFGQDTVMHIFIAVSSGEYEPVESTVPNAPEPFKRAIAGCLEVDPAKRLADCQAVINVLSEDAANLNTAGALPTHFMPDDPIVAQIRSLAFATPAPVQARSQAPLPAVRPLAAPPAKQQAPTRSSRNATLLFLIGVLGALGVAAVVVAGVSTSIAVLALSGPENAGGEGPSLEIPAHLADEVVATPTPLRMPEPTPAPEPTAKPAPAAPTTGRVTVTGDAGRVVLRNNGVDAPAAGRVRPGTYEVLAWFDDGDPHHVGNITVKAGSTVTVKCAAAWYGCTIE